MLSERLERIFTASINRIPTYFYGLDEFIQGGFPPFTLSVLVAKIHGFKSNTMANWAARQVLNGHTVVLLTLEMSEDMFAQRFDSIYSRMDINQMYTNRHNQVKLFRNLKTLYKDEKRGNLFIKQYPTGAASVADFRAYLRELTIRGINPEIIYVDYLNLMQATNVPASDLYIKGKSIAEELRALSFEFELPVVSVSQLNREARWTDFKSIDFNYISESMGVPATADFMAIIGLDEDDWIYQHEIHNKIAKNRLGGRVNEIWKTYYDERTLKMYDETEEQLWLDDAKLHEDNDRKLAQKTPQADRGPNRGR